MCHNNSSGGVCLTFLIRNMCCESFQNIIASQVVKKNDLERNDHISCDDFPFFLMFTLYTCLHKMNFENIFIIKPKG